MLTIKAHIKNIFHDESGEWRDVDVTTHFDHDALAKLVATGLNIPWDRFTITEVHYTPDDEGAQS